MPLELEIRILFEFYFPRILFFPSKSLAQNNKNITFDKIEFVRYSSIKRKKKFFFLLLLDYLFLSIFFFLSCFWAGLTFRDLQTSFAKIDDQFIWRLNDH